MVPGVMTQKVFLADEAKVESLAEVSKWLATTPWTKHMAGTKLGQIEVETVGLVSLINCCEWPRTGTLLSAGDCQHDFIIESHLRLLANGSSKCFFMNVLPETYIRVTLEKVL